jgi:hypothetical protein
MIVSKNGVTTFKRQMKRLNYTWKGNHGEGGWNACVI